MICLFGPKKFTLKGHAGGLPEFLRLCCYADADRCSAQKGTKSTSGMIISWASRKETSTARSTAEAEMVSLAPGLFHEALPLQELLETSRGRQVELTCYQDNSAVIEIVAAGHSPKLRRLSKIFRVSIGSVRGILKERDREQGADPFTQPFPVAT